MQSWSNWLTLQWIDWNKMFPVDKGLKKQPLTDSAGGNKKVAFTANSLEMFSNINSFENVCTYWSSNSFRNYPQETMRNVTTDTWMNMVSSNKLIGRIIGCLNILVWISLRIKIISIIFLKINLALHIKYYFKYKNYILKIFFFVWHVVLFSRTFSQKGNWE